MRSRSRAGWKAFIHPVTGYFRKRRAVLLKSLFPDLAQLRICDLGGSRHFWEKLDLGIPQRNITIYNISEDETAGVRGNADEIQVVLYDGKHLGVPDKSFDLLVCNSVLEHVPPELRQALCKEMMRVAHRVFVQTPCRAFPIEPHFVMPFIHWLPKRLGYPLVLVSPWRILSRPSRETIQEYFFGTNLLGRKELETLFPAAEFHLERVLGLTKSYCVKA